MLYASPIATEQCLGANKVDRAGDVVSVPLAHDQQHIVRHPFAGQASCDISSYQAQLRERQEREAQQLANLTGWDIDDIRGKIPLIADTMPDQPSSWWSRLWNCE